MGFFITKKQKQLMKERRRKGKDGPSSSDAGGETKESKKRPLTKVSSSSTAISIHAISASTAAVTATNPNIIMLPPGLSHKEAKKFRKDARRQARAEGRDESLLVFQGDHDDDDTEQQASEEQRRRKRPKKSFPSLNELVEQEKILKEQQAQKADLQDDPETLTDAYKSRYVAIDCEMVGIGSSGKQSALARVSLTGWDGQQLMDRFVKVPSRVTDFRTHVSGVKPKHLKSDAMEVKDCRDAVASLIKDKILVGHALKNDLDVLMLQHPKQDIRDTAKYRPFQRLANNKWRPRKLRDLVQENLGKAIQVAGEAHDSLEDSRAAMELFQLVRKQWEADLQEKTTKKADRVR
jgi:RNA exonuclease 4